MINKLTPDQEVRMVEVRNYWLKVGLSTDRSDRPKTEETITKMYSLIGKKPPRFIWMDSPFGAMISISLAKKCMKMGDPLEKNLWDNLWANLGDNLGANLRANLRDNLGDNLGANLGDNLGANLGANLRDNLGANLWDNLGANLGANLRANLWDNLRDNLWANLGDNLGDNLWANLYDSNYFLGSLDSYWIAYYKFANEIGVPYKKEDSEKLDLWADLSRSCFWWWAYDNVCFISDKPKAIHQNSRNQLHNESGMAMEFHDGYGFCALNGIRVPYWVVTTDAGKIDPKKALTEKNVDIQREIIRKVGAERMLKAAKAKTLDVFTDQHTKGGNEYKLLEMSVGDNIRRKYLYFEHASFLGVFYAHPVHPQLTKAIHARAWMLSIGEVPELEKMTESELRESLPCEVA